MAIVQVEQSVDLPYPARDLCALVGDVEAYPSFIPYVKSIEVTNRAVKDDGWTGLARAAIGWRAVSERFATWVRCAPALGEVDVRLAEGPFKHLENHWRFVPNGSGARVHFKVAYEFKNPILQALASLNRSLATERIMSAFVAEAHRRFGQR